MRLSGFLVGGLIGAAATVYVARRQPWAVAWAANAMSEMGSSVVRKSVEKVVSHSVKDNSSAHSPKHSEDTTVKSGAAWEQIEAIVNSDPELMKEANKIKAESSAVAH